MLHLSTVTVIVALFLANLVHADELVGNTTSVPYFLFNVRTSSLSSRDVLSHGIAKCLGLDDTNSDPFRSYSTHTLDASTVVTIQFDEEKYSNSMLAFIATVNSTDAAITCLHDNCNNLIVISIVASYDTDVVPTKADTNFFSEHPYVFVGAGAVFLMLSIVIVVVIIKRKEKREKDEYIEPLSSMEQGRVGPHPRQRQANDVGRPGQRPVIHQAKVVNSPSPNATRKAPQPRHEEHTSAPPQQEAVPEATPQQQEAVLEAAPQQQEAVPEAAPQQQEAVPEAAPQQQEAVPEAAPQQQEAVPEAAPQQQEAVPEAAPQVVAEDVPPPPAHNSDASLN